MQRVKMSISDETVLIVGGGGVPNYGDELILEGWLRWYTRTIGVAAPRIRVEGGHNRVLYSLFGDRYPGVRFSHFIRRQRVHKDPEFFDSVQRGYRFLSDPQNRDHPLHEVIDGLRIYHLHGGGYLNNRWPSHGFMVGLGLAAKERSGCTLVGTGLGLGPMDPPAEDDKLARKAFGAFDLLEVRDDWSRDFLLNNDLHDAPVRGLDDVFLQPVAAQEWSHATLHLSLRDDKVGHSVVDSLTSGLVGSFDRHVFWTGTANDTVAFEAVAKRFPFFELRTVNDLMTGFPLGHDDFMVTQRFHPHLIGARAGMQGMYSSGSSYYDVKHGSVVELGSPFTELDLEKLQAIRPHSGANVLAERDSALVAQKRALVDIRIEPVLELSRRGRILRTARKVGETAFRLRRE